MVEAEHPQILNPEPSTAQGGQEASVGDLIVAALAFNSLGVSDGFDAFDQVRDLEDLTIHDAQPRRFFISSPLWTPPVYGPKSQAR